MKPIELLNGINLKYEIYSTDKKIILNYIDKDCVVAYDKNKLGSIFIMKGKTKCFAFFYIDNKLSRYIFNRTTCKRINMKIAFQLLGNCKILDKEEYSKINKQMILESLK